MSEHSDKYEALAQRIGIDAVRARIPFSPERVEAALLMGDEHLNTLPLAKWDAAGGGMAGLMWRSAGCTSLSDHVCVLKHVAKFHYPTDE